LTSTHEIRFNQYVAPISWQPFDSIDQLKPLIQDLKCDDVFMSVPFLQSLEYSRPRDIEFRYLVFFQNEKPIGWAYVQVIPINLAKSLEFESNESGMFANIYLQLKKWLASFVDYKVLVLGNMLLTGEHGFYFDANISQKLVFKTVIEALEDCKKEWQKTWRNAKLVLIKDFYPNKIKFGSLWQKRCYSPFRIQPNMVMTLPKNIGSFDEYLAAITSKYRVRHKRAFKKLGNIERRVLTQDQVVFYLDKIYAYYLDCANNAGFNATLVPKEYFLNLSINMPKSFQIYGLFDGERLIGFYSFLINGSNFEAHFIGFDGLLNRERQLYQNMLYFMVEDAITLGCKKIIFARTAIEIKSTVGAIPIEMDLYMKHSNFFIQLFIPFLLRYFTPKEKYIVRDPFKHELE